MTGQTDEKIAVAGTSTPVHGIQNSNLQTPNSKPETRNPKPNVNTGRSLGQILIVLVVLLVLVNIPINDYGLGLAHIVPDDTAAVVYDGMVLKGSGSEIYLLEDHKLRWISGREARGSYFHSANVRTVDDSVLKQFEQGQPIRRLVKCHNSSLVYALENGQKRWVENPPPEDKANKPWDKVYQVTCNFLDGLPDGLPIPENAGAPPQP